MTMPVSAGKNACFGFEDDEENQSRLGPLESHEAGAPLTSQASSAESAAGSTNSTADCALLPDYYTVSGGAGLGVTANLSATVDRYGHIYTAGGGGLGSGVGGAAHVGYLRDADHPCDPPDEATLRSFLSGPALFAGGGAGVSIGVTHSSGMTAREIGVSTPQLGVSYTLGAEHGE
jgi:hypothetical protein